MHIPALIGHVLGIAIAVMVPGPFPPPAWGQGATGSNVIILLRFAGDTGAAQQLRSCRTSRLSEMPDTEIAAGPADGVRFVVDVIAEKRAVEDVSASLVVAETFPLEQFRPRIKEGEDGAALLTSIRYYTLLRLHELVPGRSLQTLCENCRGNWR